MHERREYPRKSVSLPASFLLPPHPHLQVKIIDICKKGARFLCPISPGIASEAELIFRLPFDDHSSLRLDEDNYEFKVTVNVKHLYDVLATPGAPPDYRYVVGVKFMNLNGNEQAILERFLTKLR